MLFQVKKIKNRITLDDGTVKIQGDYIGEYEAEVFPGIKKEIKLKNRKYTVVSIEKHTEEFGNKLVLNVE